MTDEIRIGITQGDPGGIGPEIIFKTFYETNLPPHVKFILFSSKEYILKLGKNSPLAKRFYEDFIFSRQIEIEEVQSPPHFKIGEATSEGGAFSYDAVVSAIDAALVGKIDGIVTAPINKKAWFMAGRNYPGHTDLLADMSQVSNYAMMLVADPLRVTLVTTHIPFRDVADSITSEKVLNKIKLTHHFLKYHLKEHYIKPIAVLALNPHGGEDGNIGRDEEVIEEAIEEAKNEGINAAGPFSADTYFVPYNIQKFSGTIAMYHDQGLIPLKVLAFGRGVNITLGLPFWRTSPDHGTAYDIAGKNIANPTSMIEAIELALKLIENKRNNLQWTNI
ncbi:4-hydroxythreonine-4-phosphate dehydrogenase PdxA [bacterium]|nr:4-hydroxythreonine-4-phosphate dehydrogenase PdxA [bacterium]